MTCGCLADSVRKCRLYSRGIRTSERLARAWDLLRPDVFKAHIGSRALRRGDRAQPTRDGRVGLLRGLLRGCRSMDQRGRDAARKLSERLGGFDPDLRRGRVTIIGFAHRGSSSKIDRLDCVVGAVSGSKGRVRSSVRFPVTEWELAVIRRRRSERWGFGWPRQARAFCRRSAMQARLWALNFNFGYTQFKSGTTMRGPLHGVRVRASRRVTSTAACENVALCLAGGLKRLYRTRAERLAHPRIHQLAGRRQSGPPDRIFNCAR